MALKQQIAKSYMKDKFKKKNIQIPNTELDYDIGLPNW